MTIIDYSTARQRASHSIRQPLSSTAHHGERWTCVVNVLRMVTHGAVEEASPRQSATVEAVGLEIIDHIDKLDAKRLHVLQTVFSILVRTAQRNHS